MYEVRDRVAAEIEKVFKELDSLVVQFKECVSQMDDKFVLKIKEVSDEVETKIDNMLKNVGKDNRGSETTVHEGSLG